MRAPASTPRVGSSAKNTAGLAAIDRANRTFCWLPPDRFEMVVSCDGAFIASEEPYEPASASSRWRETNPKRVSVRVTGRERKSKPLQVVVSARRSLFASPLRSRESDAARERRGRAKVLL